MDLKQISQKTVAVIAAISWKRGMELHNLHRRSIDIPKFLIFLDDLRRLHWADDIALFVDQLSVHRSKRVRERLEELSIPVIYNASYSPDNNPIENIFGMVKTKFRRKRLDDITTGKREDIHHNIIQSFGEITQNDCTKSIWRSYIFLKT